MRHIPRQVGDGMDAKTKQPNPRDAALEWPIYWFASLERAIEQGDYRAAATAQDNLRRLGYEVMPRKAKAVAS